MHVRAAQSGTTHLAPRATWDWHEQAACSGEGTDLFFAPDGETPTEKDKREELAKDICNTCPMRIFCRDDALYRKDLEGIRGGLTPDELKAERRRRVRSGRIPNVPGSAA